MPKESSNAMSIPPVTVVVPSPSSAYSNSMLPWERADCLPAHDLGIQAILVRAASSDFALQAGDVLEAANIVRSGASS